MAVGQQRVDMLIKLDSEKLQEVDEFIYLGGVMTEDRKCKKDIKRRIGIASAIVNKFGKLWRAKNISNMTKVKLYKTFVVPIVLYGSECWCLKKGRRT